MPLCGEGPNDLVEHWDSQLGEFATARALPPHDFAGQREYRKHAVESCFLIPVLRREVLCGVAGKQLDIELSRGGTVSVARLKLALEKPKFDFEAGKSPLLQKISPLHVSYTFKRSLENNANGMIKLINKKAGCQADGRKSRCAKGDWWQPVSMGKLDLRGAGVPRAPQEACTRIQVACRICILNQLECTAWPAVCDRASMATARCAESAAPSCQPTMWLI
jgi:hypothetical protein